MGTIWAIVLGFAILAVVLLALKPRPDRRGRRGESLIEDGQLDP
jgi:hypothetical protein